jgi:hypothetical protein
MQMVARAHSTTSSSVTLLVVINVVSQEGGTGLRIDLVFAERAEAEDSNVVAAGRGSRARHPKDTTSPWTSKSRKKEKE